MTRSTLKQMAFGLILLCSLAVGTLVLGAYQSGPPAPAEMSVFGMDGKFGGAFEMTDVRRGPVTEADFSGKPMALFFGFTSCPDICPTMLTQMTSWLSDLDQLADKIHPIFVSVDPERDTAEVMAQYLGVFDPRITGLVGTPEQLASFANNYGIFYEKVPLGGGEYTMNHTAGILLFDGNGKFRGIADYHDDPDAALTKFRRLAERGT